MPIPVEARPASSAATDTHSVSILLPILYRDDRGGHRQAARALVHRSCGPDAKPDSRYSSCGTRSVDASGPPIVWTEELPGVLIFGLDPETAAFLGATASAKLPKPHRALVPRPPTEQLTIDHPSTGLRIPTCWGPAHPPEPKPAPACGGSARFELDIPIDRYPTSRYALVGLPRRLAVATSCAATSNTLPTPSSACHLREGATQSLLCRHFDCHRLSFWPARAGVAPPRRWAGHRTKTPVGDTFAATLALAGRRSVADRDSSSSWAMISLSRSDQIGTQSIPGRTIPTGPPSSRRRPGHAESRPQPSCEEGMGRAYRPGWSADL